jgi:large subunit ribosomal protein L5
MKTVAEKQNKAFETLKGDLKLSNTMQTPKVTKVIVSVGTGSLKDKKKGETIIDRIAKITGQKAAPRAAKKSIATFKLRQGDVVGYQVTLRGARMNAFLDKLLNVALPRTRDFRGISKKGIDEMGNYSLGIKENTIFPETSDEDLRDVFGMSITIVTNAKDRKQTEALLTYLGFPFKKNETVK